MRGFIVKDSKGSVVSKYQGGNQSSDDVLKVNGFDGGYTCDSFTIGDGYSVDDYDSDCKLIDWAVKKCHKASEFMLVNKDIIGALLNEINELREVLNLPNRGRLDVLDYVKDLYE